GRVIAAATIAEELAPGEAARVTAVRASVGLFDAASGKEVRRIDGFPDNLPVVALAFRPDGKELACGSGFAPGEHPRRDLPQPAGNAVGLRLVSLDVLPETRPANQVYDLSFAPDGKHYLVVASGKVAVRDAATDRTLWDAPADAARYTTDGTTVLTLGPDFARREAATGKVVQSVPRAKMDFAPQGKILRRLPNKVIEIDLGSSAQVNPGLTFIVLPVDFPEKGRPSRLRQFRDVDERGNVRTRTEFVPKATIEVTEVLGPALSRARITSEFDDIREAVLAGDLLYPSAGQKGVGEPISAISASGSRYASLVEFAVRPFDTATGDSIPLDPEQGRPGGVVRAGFGEGVRFSPDGKWLAAVGVHLGLSETGAAVWDMTSGKRAFLFPPPGNLGDWRPTTALAFSPDNKTLAIAVGPAVHLFETGRWDHRDQLPDTPGSGPVTALEFSPDGKRLAVGYRLPLLHGGDKEPKVIGHKTEVQLIDLAAKKEVRRLDGFEGVNHMGPTKLPVTALAFSPDGTTLLAGTGWRLVASPPPGPPAPGEVKRFNLADPPPAAPDPPAVWREKATLPGFENAIRSVAFSPDGKSLAVGGGGEAAEYPVTLWDVGALKRLWSGGVVQAGPTGVSFSPDGKFLATAHGKTTDLLDPATGKSVGMNPPLPGGEVAAFCPAEERVAGQMRYRIAVTGGRSTSVTGWFLNGPTATATFGVLKDQQPRFVEGKDVPPRFWEGEAGVSWSPDGTRLVFIPNSKNDPAGVQWYAQVWGGGGGAKEVALTHGPAPVTAVAW
ncbi:MAG TPA: hypothetical protein VH092_38710, partial [Urbifossiella sp.]|nr:hypothetical protein [Urbifossiella sp.]